MGRRYDAVALFLLNKQRRRRGGSSLWRYCNLFVKRACLMRLLAYEGRNWILKTTSTKVLHFCLTMLDIWLLYMWHKSAVKVNVCVQMTNGYMYEHLAMFYWVVGIDPPSQLSTNILWSFCAVFSSLYSLIWSFYQFILLGLPGCTLCQPATHSPAALRARWETFPACSHITGGAWVFAFHFDHSTNNFTHK